MEKRHLKLSNSFLYCFFCLLVALCSNMSCSRSKKLSKVFYYSADSLWLRSGGLSSYKIKDQDKKITINLKLKNHAGFTYFEIINSRNGKILSKGEYIPNIIDSIGTFCIKNCRGNEQILIVGRVSFPCKNGIWTVYKNDQLVRIEEWRCDTLVNSIDFGINKSGSP